MLPDTNSPGLSRSKLKITSQIVIAGIINGHVATKYIYIRMFRGKDVLHQRSFLAIGSWTAIVVVLWVLAWVIAEGIPVFNNLLGLIVRRNISAI